MKCKRCVIFTKDRLTSKIVTLLLKTMFFFLLRYMVFDYEQISQWKKKFKKDYIERIKYSGMGVLKILFKI